MQKLLKKYFVLSPDEITLFHDEPFYRTKKARQKSFDRWAKRYEHQGYYSFRGERIPLAELKENCKWLEIEYTPNPRTK